MLALLIGSTAALRSEPVRIEGAVWGDPGPNGLVARLAQHADASEVELVSLRFLEGGDVNFSEKLVELTLENPKGADNDLQIKARNLRNFLMRGGAVKSIRFETPSIHAVGFDDTKCEAIWFVPEPSDAGIYEFNAFSSSGPIVLGRAGRVEARGSSFTGELKINLENATKSGELFSKGVELTGTRIGTLQLDCATAFEVKVVNCHIQDFRVEGSAVGAFTMESTVVAGLMLVDAAFDPEAGKFEVSKSSFEQGLVCLGEARLPGEVSIGFSAFRNGLDFRLADTGSVRKLNLAFLDVEPEKVFVAPGQFSRIELDLTGDDRIWPENTIQLLSDSLVKRGHPGAAEAFRLKLERAKTSAEGSFVRYASDVFFGYGYQPWRWLLFAMLPVAALSGLSLRYGFPAEVERLGNRIRGKDSEELSTLGRSMKMVAAMYLACAFLFSLKFKIEWLTGNRRFNAFVIAVYVLGIVMYLALFLGAKSSFFESAKHLLGF